MEEEIEEEEDARSRVGREEAAQFQICGVLRCGKRRRRDLKRTDILTIKTHGRTDTDGFGWSNRIRIPFLRQLKKKPQNSTNSRPN